MRNAGVETMRLTTYAVILVYSIQFHDPLAKITYKLNTTII